MTAPDLAALYRRAMVCAELQCGQDRDASRLAMMMIAAAHRGRFVALGTQWGWADARGAVR